LSVRRESERGQVCAAKKMRGLFPPLSPFCDRDAPLKVFGWCPLPFFPRVAGAADGAGNGGEVEPSGTVEGNGERTRFFLPYGRQK